MLCPDCKCNAFEPVYKEMPKPLILDAPYPLDAVPRKVLIHFRCSECDAIYYVMARETQEQAYWRIIRDHAK